MQSVSFNGSRSLYRLPMVLVDYILWKWMKRVVRWSLKCGIQTQRNLGFPSHSHSSSLLWICSVTTCCKGCGFHNSYPGLNRRNGNKVGHLPLVETEKRRIKINGAHWQTHVDSYRLMNIAYRWASLQAKNKQTEPGLSLFISQAWKTGFYSSACLLNEQAKLRWIPRGLKSSLFICLPYL